MSNPVYEIISTNTFAIACQPVYIPTGLSLTLSEPGSSFPSPATFSVPGGAYTTATFATTLQTLLHGASLNSFNYVVTAASSNVTPLPGVTPIVFGTSYNIVNGGHPFTLV